jgi:PTH1 family peptidyl-tRNA hydrolase
VQLVLGLGNIGEKYTDTRHNIGFWIVEALAKAFHADWQTDGDVALTARIALDDEEIVLAKPTTFMNLSGKAAFYLLNKYQINISDFIIINDDVSLPIGKIRFRSKGGSGGHNGIKSVISYLDTEQFSRLKVGIGNPQEDMDLVEFVLGEYSDEEAAKMETVVEICKEAILYYLKSDINDAMNKYNGINIIDE